MAKQASNFSVYFDGNEFENYLKEMSLPGTWGDELTIRAIADYFECAIHIITTTESNYYIRYNPELEDGSPSPSPKRHLFFTYISPIHYNSFGLKNDGPIESIHSCHERLVAEGTVGRS